MANKIPFDPKRKILMNHPGENIVYVHFYYNQKFKIKM